MLKGSAPITPHEGDRVDQLDSPVGFLGHGSQPQTCHTQGHHSVYSEASPLPPQPAHSSSFAIPPPPPGCTTPHPLRSGILFTQNGKCLVVTMTLGQCSFPMHTNILWLLYMNIFNDMEKVVDFLKFFLFV
uniref:Uncharacterized protein n=1 Tax=Myotis myotis TaxID=51298 RepID=A0A7J7T6Q3_MYOMY|nr:hypothetical protein mMyoMyo1_009261 [Myotis myotis]